MTVGFQSFWKPPRRSAVKRDAERKRKLTRAQCRAAVMQREIDVYAE